MAAGSCGPPQMMIHVYPPWLLKQFMRSYFLLYNPKRSNISGWLLSSKTFLTSFQQCHMPVWNTSRSKSISFQWWFYNLLALSFLMLFLYRWFFRGDKIAMAYDFSFLFILLLLRACMDRPEQQVISLTCCFHRFAVFSILFIRSGPDSGHAERALFSCVVGWLFGRIRLSPRAVVIWWCKTWLPVAFFLGITTEWLSPVFAYIPVRYVLACPFSFKKASWKTRLPCNYSYQCPFMDLLLGKKKIHLVSKYGYPVKELLF